MSKEESIAIAAEYGMVAEVSAAIHDGVEPIDALKDWDLI